MKANEFVEKFGLDSFKAAILCPQFKRYSYAILYSDEVDFSNNFIDKHADYMFKTSEIKRIVESHELVRLGLPELKKAMFSDSKDLEYVKNWVLTVSDKLLTEKGIKLKQAILDVESYNE